MFSVCFGPITSYDSWIRSTLESSWHVYILNIKIEWLIFLATYVVEVYWHKFLITYFVLFVWLACCSTLHALYFWFWIGYAHDYCGQKLIFKWPKVSHVNYWHNEAQTIYLGPTYLYGLCLKSWVHNFLVLIQPWFIFFFWLVSVYKRINMHIFVLRN